ncbi:kinesin-like protein KIN-7J isoform X2 [Neltuma alba]|uniref:kinesin-like protein KIN-7J isoform X2 n=1 Tax=Neltuma alba TaxID=207710 RepID=UPI0010A551FE|nr:kinesin-like protein KIN-7J isoform X2 [Prosopis alba]
MGGEEAVTGGEETIFVSVRIRPLNDKERAKNDVSDWECISNTTVIHRNNISASDRSLYPTAYTFDRVFGTDCSTRQVYEEAAKEVALSVVSGINSSIFAYGQTSSGKTYTMSGITEYTVADIYNYIEKHEEREFVLKFSAIEIYNESVRDLLSLDSTPLRLLDDPERGTVVERLTEETLRDWNHFSELISFCETQRQIGETSLNQASSRSHQILRLTIESSAREFLGNDKSSSLAASVNFIDLAGSERASQTLSAGARLKEGCHINRSLLTLGTVIRKLSKGRNGHVPFRDSKLTRILQSSLGGNARTAIICTMSPARSHVEQTRNTLLFASCAKEVSTNAQVNVVVSDKALVKQLQRELARLESELRNSGSAGRAYESTALLREKDLQIEKLKKEVAELTIQRDLAQSQIKDMLQAAEDDLSSIELESPDPQYPKLRVRGSWDLENHRGKPNLSSLNCMESVRSFNASQYSDGHSVSSDENLFQLPDFEKNLPGANHSPRPSFTDLDAVDIELSPSHIEQENDENLEGHWKEVRCIESEDITTNKVTPSTIADSSPNPYIHSNASSPGANTSNSGLTIVDNGGKMDLVSSRIKEDKESNIFHQDFVVRPMGQTSPCQSETYSSRGLKLHRSRSCKASLMMNSSSYWFDKEEIIESKTSIGIENEFTASPGGFQQKVCALDYYATAETQSGNDSRNSDENGSVDEVPNIETSIDMESEANKASFPERKEEEDLVSVNQSIDHKEKEDLVSVNQPIDHEENEDLKTTNQPIEHKKEDLVNVNHSIDHKVPETGLETPISAKSFKDVGLDPMQSDGESPSNWPTEFKRFQREIIELWDACNVSLVHRTYFFLLFKGDSSDSIYMEVELRRLSYLKQTQGDLTVKDGQILSSSVRNLRRERQMLSRQMQRRLSKSERENLYLKWGIRLSSKNRALQLAHRLWTDTKDMDHIADSAAVVAKLLGSVEPKQAFKEMFGLNFAPRRPTRRSFGWTFSIKHIL